MQFLYWTPGSPVMLIYPTLYEKQIYLRKKQNTTHFPVFGLIRVGQFSILKTWLFTLQKTCLAWQMTYPAVFELCVFKISQIWCTFAWDWCKNELTEAQAVFVELQMKTHHDCHFKSMLLIPQVNDPEIMFWGNTYQVSGEKKSSLLFYT